jgi:sec-independent protein translocase protein TatB
MFDVGFSELVVIALVALIVIGPERLPKVARTAGHLLGRLQRYVNDVKADISREMELDELKKLQAEMAEKVKALEKTVSKEVGAVETSLNQAIAPPPTDGVTEPATPAAQVAPLVAVADQQLAAAGGAATASATPAEVPVASPAQPQPAPVPQAGNV